MPNAKLCTGCRYVVTRSFGPVIRRFRLPNGGDVVSLRRDAYERELDAIRRGIATRRDALVARASGFGWVRRWLGL